MYRACGRSRLLVLAVVVLIGGCAVGSGGRGAPWTIECARVSAPDAREYLERVAETLRRTRGIAADDVYVFEHADGSSGLYYGTYWRRRDSKTGRRGLPPQMRTDIDLLRQLVDDSGRRFFLRAIPVRKPMPDVGNPAWVLRGVQAKYSLQVAAFEPTDDFWDYKAAAAAYCEYLRSKGYEAYYHHTSTASVVTVGAFGREAVATGPSGRRYYSEAVRTLQQDELLRYNLVNGSVHRVRTEQGVFVPVPSRLVEIPRAGGGC